MYPSKQCCPECNHKFKTQRGVTHKDMEARRKSLFTNDGTGSGLDADLLDGIPYPDDMKIINSVNGIPYPPPPNPNRVYDFAPMPPKRGWFTKVLDSVMEGW